MESSPFVQAALTEALWVIGGGALGLILALGMLFRLTQQRATPPGAVASGVGVLGLATVLAGVAGLANPALPTGALAASVVRLLGAMATLPLAGLCLLGLAVLGAQGPRRWGLPAGLFALVLGAAACSLCGGIYGLNPLFGGVRAVAIVGLGALFALSAAGTADRGPAAAAGLVWALAVGALEGANQGLIAAIALQVGSQAELALRAEALTQMLAAVAPGTGWGWASLGFAAVGAGVAAGVDARAAGPGRALGLLWLGLLPAGFAVGLPDLDALIAAAEASPKTPVIAPEAAGD